MTRVTDIAACLKHIYVFCYIDVLRTGADRACRNDSASALLIGVTPKSPHYCCWADGWVEVLLTFFDGGGGGSSMRVASRAEWTHSSAPLSSRSSRPPQSVGGWGEGGGERTCSSAPSSKRSGGRSRTHSSKGANAALRRYVLPGPAHQEQFGYICGRRGELPCKGLQTALW